MKVKNVLKDKVALICLLLLGTILLLVLLAPFVTKFDPDQQDIINKLQRPSLMHWLGTDQLGRDIYSRVLYGGRITLLLAGVITFIVLSLGFFFGWLSATYGGKIDQVITFICDALMSLPSEVLSLIIIGLLGPDILTIIIAITFAKWPWYVRMFRSEIQTYLNENYIQFSKVMGKSNFWILRHHLLKNLRASFVVYSTLNLSGIIMSIAALSFLGIGVQPPTAEWGVMINEAKNYAIVDYWQLIPVGLAMFLVLAALNYLGDQFAAQIPIK